MLRPVRVRHGDVDDIACRAVAAKVGLPAVTVDALSEYYAAQREGRMEVRAEEVEQVTGRPAMLFDEWSREAAAAW